MTDADKRLLNFEDFRAQVGATERQVRRALRELGLRPIPLLHDMRQTGYEPAWIESVRKWLLEHRVKEDQD